ncbi:unnamed protein product [Ilex paraguariensis]|uniref:Uncharacterized protein n=1 Tax=Ilex paraguariensis TaxID=185542 RepID=A0ABC8RPU2_9AQUA
MPITLKAPDCFSSSMIFSCCSSSSRDKPPSLFRSFNLNTRIKAPRMFRRYRANLITNPDSFEVGRLIGSYGFMNITSYSGFQSRLDIEYPSEDMRILRVQDVGEGNVKIRLYEGRIAQGSLRGTPVIFKLQEGSGGLSEGLWRRASAAVNWLSRYSQLEEGSGGLSEGLWRRASAAGAFTPMDKRTFGIADDIYEAGLLFAYLAFIPFSEAGIMDSLSLQRLLESTFQLDLEATRDKKISTLPSECMNLVEMRTCVMTNVTWMVVNLLQEGSGGLSEGLWRRASAAGAFTPMDKRTFGIADDIYEAGLLFAYLAFIPFSEAGIMDSLSLQRLLESTFQLDLEATRDKKISTLPSECMNLVEMRTCVMTNVTWMVVNLVLLS